MTTHSELGKKEIALGWGEATGYLMVCSAAKALLLLWTLGSFQMSS